MKITLIFLVNYQASQILDQVQNLAKKSKLYSAFDYKRIKHVLETSNNG